MPSFSAKQKKQMFLGVLLLGLIILIYWQYSIFFPSTDDAFVEANIVNVSPQVSGKVNAIYVQNHQGVKTGDLLLMIDPQPLMIALQQAQAQLELAKQQAAADQDAVVTAKAVVAQRTAEYNNAKVDSMRAIKLAKEGVLSRQMADDAKAKIATTSAALSAAQAELQQAQDTLGKSGDQNAAIRNAQAAVDQAQLNLGYTKIFASAKGNVENFNLRVGDVVNANTPAFAIVDGSEWWVDANYNETDLARIHPGQHAEIHIDMYSDKTFHGIVESISRGSGATFSLLPPENATGNWVKVTQRFPVRVKLIDVNAAMPPRVGASANVTINTLY